MSIVSSHASAQTSGTFKLSLAKAGVAVAATAAVALVLATLAHLVFASGMLTAPAPRNPFATGAATYSPMTTSGIGGIILMVQAQFYAALTAAVQALKHDGVGLMSLVTIGFLYGIFHAAGPGHGKGVITGYVLTSRSSFLHGLTLSLAAALLQAIVAIALVGTLAMVLNASAATIDSAARDIEIVSFAGVAGMGLILLWSKSDELVRLVSGRERDQDDDAAALRRIARRPMAGNWRLLSGVVLAAGIRPCSGAIILLVFSLSQGLFAAGVAGALAMAVGTWITTGTLASLTVFAKSLVRRATGAGGMTGPIVFAGLEVLAAAFVLTLGSLLLAGIWAGGLASALD
jgi:ABC-type nickel/cobalt efflux system permease component RcnA